MKNYSFQVVHGGATLTRWLDKLVDEASPPPPPSPGSSQYVSVSIRVALQLHLLPFVDHHQQQRRRLVMRQLGGASSRIHNIQSAV